MIIRMIWAVQSANRHSDQDISRLITKLYY